MGLNELKSAGKGFGIDPVTASGYFTKKFMEDMTAIVRATAIVTEDLEGNAKETLAEFNAALYSIMEKDKTRQLLLVSILVLQLVQMMKVMSPQINAILSRKGPHHEDNTDVAGPEEDPR